MSKSIKPKSSSRGLFKRMLQGVVILILVILALWGVLTAVDAIHVHTNKQQLDTAYSSVHMPEQLQLTGHTWNRRTEGEINQRLYSIYTYKTDMTIQSANDAIIDSLQHANYKTDQAYSPFGATCPTYTADNNKYFIAVNIPSARFDANCSILNESQTANNLQIIVTKGAPS